MNHAVQEIVDRLAVRVGRPAVLEDRYLRLVAHSAHDEPVDEVRETSILQRHASAEVSRWLSHEARMAAMAAAALPGVGETVRWSHLGVYQVAATLADRAERPPVPHDGLRRLLDLPEALPLLETLETYLDAAGNAQLTAELLHLHRTSLYYRLQRVEQLARTDLKNGVERLALHLSLKVARMTGQYVPRNGCDRRLMSSAPVPTSAR